MGKKIEVLKITKINYTVIGSYSDTETLGLFSTEDDIHRAVGALGFDVRDFDYLSADGNIPDDSYGMTIYSDDEERVIIYWETYDLDEFTESTIWEDYCEEYGV